MGRVFCNITFMSLVWVRMKQLFDILRSRPCPCQYSTHIYIICGHLSQSYVTILWPCCLLEFYPNRPSWVTGSGITVSFLITDKSLTKRKYNAIFIKIIMVKKKTQTDIGVPRPLLKNLAIPDCKESTETATKLNHSTKQCGLLWFLLFCLVD